MAAGATAHKPAADRTCPDCHAPIEAPRRYCDRDRDRRRALTFLYQALGAIGADPRGDGRDEARRRIHGALEELGA